MSAEADLLAILDQHAPLTTLVGAEIHRDAQPEGGAFPSVVFARSGTDPVSTIHGSAPAAFVSFAINCNAEAGADAQLVAEAVEAALIVAGELPEGRSGGYDPESGLYINSVAVTVLET